MFGRCVVGGRRAVGRGGVASGQRGGQRLVRAKPSISRTLKNVHAMPDVAFLMTFGKFRLKEQVPV